MLYVLPRAARLGWFCKEQRAKSHIYLGIQARHERHRHISGAQLVGDLSTVALMDLRWVHTVACTCVCAIGGQQQARWQPRPAPATS